MPEEQFPVAGQPFIYAGVEKAPGGGKKLLFVRTHGRSPLHIAISGQDYDTMIRDGTPAHGLALQTVVSLDQAISMVGALDCPSCNHGVTPRTTGNGSEVECPGCGHRWPLYREV